MCNNSLIYLTTPSVATVAANGILPLTTIVRRRGQSIQQSNDSVVLGAPGYYHASVSLTFTAPAAGIATVQLMQDGIPVSGATASTTITTATTEVRSLSFDAIVRVPCCGSPVTLSAVNAGIAITTSNVSIAVEYLD
jgi:hypothetical protein